MFVCKMIYFVSVFVQENTFRFVVGCKKDPAPYWREGIERRILANRVETGFDRGRD